MADGMRRLLLRMLRVPPMPEPPPGDGRTALTFRAARRYFHYKVVLWALSQASALAALIGGWIFLSSIVGRAPFLPFGLRLWALIEVVASGAFLAQLPFSFLLLRLDFEMRWYMLSDRSLRIREGTVVVREKTMTFANIQNIAIRQNPLQRLFGLSTVVVRAAGGGSAGTDAHGGSGHSNAHEARFEGVDNGDRIRDIVRDRIRMHRDGGLGDPDDPELDGDVDAASVSPIDAAHMLLEEARALRFALHK